MFLLLVVVVVFMAEIHTICSYYHNHHHHYRYKKNSLVSAYPNLNKNMMILFNNMRSTIIQGDSLDDDRNDDDSDDNDDVAISTRSSSRLQSYNFPIDTSIPGHIKQLPYTLNDKTRLQYASIVVSTAIVFMTLKVRYDKWIDKWNNNMISKDMDNNYNYYDQSMMRDDNKINTNADDNNIVKLRNTGIIYEDTVIIDKDDNDDDDRTTTTTTSISTTTTTTTTTKVLDYGRQYNLSIKVYYNGLLINNYINISFIYGMKNIIFNKLSLSGLNEIGIFDGMTVNNKNNNYQGNTKRILILPAKYAYGDQGLLPYVPAKAAVKVELSIM
jgi:hypothetical protein